MGLGFQICLQIFSRMTGWGVILILVFHGKKNYPHFFKFFCTQQVIAHLFPKNSQLFGPPQISFYGNSITTGQISKISSDLSFLSLITPKKDLMYFFWVLHTSWGRVCDQMDGVPHSKLSSPFAESPCSSSAQDIGLVVHGGLQNWECGWVQARHLNLHQNCQVQAFGLFQECPNIWTMDQKLRPSSRMRICDWGFWWGVIGYNYERPEGKPGTILSRFVLDPGNALRRWVQGPPWVVSP